MLATKLAVVLVGYSRPASILRLLSSVLEKNCDIEADLIVSIDKSPLQNLIVSELSGVKWSYGDFKIIAHKDRLGLRSHILYCGDLALIYDAVIVLEDDIVVSNSFLRYVSAAINFIGQNDDIAGISLYSPSINEMAMLPFVPKKNGFDNYYLQSAQSWGQCWTREMWFNFRKWYDDNKEILDDEADMPERVYSWPITSWKKYYMKYLVETGKTFFYPFDSYSTNFTDVGQHNKFNTPLFQVPLINDKRTFSFAKLNEASCYDIFYERLGLLYFDSEVCLDIYGTKKTSTSRFFLSSKNISAPIVATFGLNFRPQEDNFVRWSPGSDIYLYDLQGCSDLLLEAGSLSCKLSNYHSNLDWRNCLLCGFVNLKSAILKKVKFK